ncbi:MAG: hypothetical protein AAGB93_01750 [Planctomycetota bacterium]
MARDDGRLTAPAGGDGAGGGRVATFHQVLIILFGTMFFASGSDSLDDRVEDLLPEGERRERALDLIDRIEDHGEDELHRFTEWHDRFYTMIESGERSPEAARAAVAELMDGANDFDRRSIDLFMELRGAIEPDEWSELFGD